MAAGAFAQCKVGFFKQVLDILHSEYDRLRLVLGLVYDKEFPTAEESAEEEARSLGKMRRRPRERRMGRQIRRTRGHKHANQDDETGFRTWTTADGKYPCRGEVHVG